MFRGLFQIIEVNPNGIVDNFVYLFHVLTVTVFSDDQLNNLAYELITNFKSLSGNQWSTYINQFPPDMQNKIRDKFNV